MTIVQKKCVGIAIISDTERAPSYLVNIMQIEWGIIEKYITSDNCQRVLPIHFPRAVPTNHYTRMVQDV